MGFRSYRYFIAEAVRSLVKNRLMSIASILTVGSCILIVSIFYCVWANIEFFLKQLESSIEITIYVSDDIDADGINVLHDALMNVEYITSVRFLNREDALNSLRAIFEDDAGILDGLDGAENPLRRSFIIEFDDLANHDRVVTILEGMKGLGVDRIRHSQDITRMTLAISRTVRLVCISLILILGVISVVIITNTIRITVNARKTEINIMKYVGATDWFIRWPFLIEGILIGVLGSLIPVGVCWGGYDRVVEMIKESIPVISFVEFRVGQDIFVQLFPFSVALGVIIGTIGSVTSIRRHLHV
jgi:cell division transport system permease protein